MINRFNFIKIIKINALLYHYLTRNKKNKLFFLIINEIYDIINKLFEIISQTQKNNRISINKSYHY